MDGLDMFLAFIGAFVLLLVLIGIVLYVLLAVGLYQMAKNENIEYEWFAFIPILQLYIIGKILKEVKVLDYTVPKLELVLPLAPIATMILNVIPFIGWLLNLAYIVFSIIVMYYFFKRYKGEQATILTIVSVIFPFMFPIFIFSLRNAMPLTGRQ